MVNLTKEAIYKKTIALMVLNVPGIDACSFCDEAIKDDCSGNGCDEAIRKARLNYINKKIREAKRLLEEEAEKI